MRLTPTILEAAYEFLLTTPPFNRWRLPLTDHVEFHISRVRDKMGQSWTPAGTADAAISISEANVSHTATLVRVMAHEMTHLACSGAAEHGREWRRKAMQVCRHHGFDPKEF